MTKRTVIAAVGAELSKEPFLGRHLIDGAGHWVQQEQPAEVARLLLAFLGPEMGDRQR